MTDHKRLEEIRGRLSQRHWWPQRWPRECSSDVRFLFSLVDTLRAEAKAARKKALEGCATYCDIRARGNADARDMVGGQGNLDWSDVHQGIKTAFESTAVHFRALIQEGE